MADVTELREMAKALGLWNVAGGRIDITDETVSNMEYLYKIFKSEIDMRKTKKIKDLKKESHLPDKVLKKENLTQGLIWQLQKTEQFDFKNGTQNFIIVGDCASGKTSAACEIGIYALKHEARVQYITLEDLLIAVRNNLPRWKKILKTDVVIIDDVFYATPTDEELTLFYKTVMFLSETRSIIIVSNRPLSEWSKMGVDKHLAETLRKRLMANAQLIHLK